MMHNFSRSCGMMAATLLLLAEVCAQPPATESAPRGCRRAPLESTLDQNKKSHVGAIGVMQIMPATGKSLKVGDVKITESTSMPAQSTWTS